MKRAVAVLTVLSLPLVGVGTAQADHVTPCRVVKILERAGFNGQTNRIAYAIVMRESRGQNLSESSPWYTGALGMWQIQTSAHSSKRWWSRAKMLTPRKQSRIAYRHLTERGTNWAHWGINRNGTGMDLTYYSGWSSSQQWEWIWAPYQRYYSTYPNCR